jgi:3-oxoacyl-[acyl-carrier protein] reductase
MGRIMTQPLFGPYLAGKHAIVTGGNAGIGKAIAELFAQHGAFVSIIGRNVNAGAEGVASIEKLCGQPRAAFYSADVSQKEQVDAAVAQILDARPVCHIVVNNAGITRDNLLLKMTEEDWDAVIDTNLKSCYNVCKAIIRPMIRQRFGCIVNVSSVIGLVGNAGQFNYSAAKAGMIGLTKTLAKEMAGRGIRANAIAPGFIETPMTQALGQEQRLAQLARIPLGRFGSPEEVANVALFLASDLSSYLTGQVVTVDGGLIG